MNPQLKLLNEQFASKKNQFDVLVAKLNEGSISAEEQKSLTDLNKDLDTLTNEIKNLQQSIEIAKKASGYDAFIKDGAANAAEIALNAASIENKGNQSNYVKMDLPSSAKYARVKNFKKREGDSYTPAEKAYRFAKFLQCVIAPNESSRKKAVDWCNDHGMSMKAQVESTNTVGGWLVPEEFEMDLIDLREQFGTFRQWARIKRMKSDTRTDPRRVGGLTAYFAGETQAIADSMKNWDRVSLQAKKVMCLIKYSSELDEDALIDIGDDLAKEIAYAFAIKEDYCGYLGDGTDQYGGIVGVKQKLLLSNSQGVIVAPSGATNWANLIFSDFSAVVGALPQYADTPDAAWFCHRTFFYSVMVPSMLRAGGTSAAEVAQGRKGEFNFLGYPVHVTQAMPAATAATDIPVFFGDLGLAATFGDRREMTIAMSEHYQFTADEIVMRGTERFDINVHDVGDSTKIGPIVALQLHA